MDSNSIALGILKAVGVIIAIVLFGFLVYSIRAVIAYLAIAIVVALISRPIVSFLANRLGLSNAVSVLLTMFAMLGLLLGILSLYIPLLAEHTENLSLLNVERLQNEISIVFEKISEYLGASPQIVEKIVEEVETETAVIEEIQIGFMPKLVKALLEIFSSAGVGIFSVLFISYFLLIDGKRIQSVVLKLVPKSEEHRVVSSMITIKNLLTRYFIGLLFQALILFAIYTVTLLVVGVKNALLIAFLCALFNIIPYIGPIIGAVIMIVLTITSEPNVDLGLVVIPKIGYVLTGLVFGQLVDNLFSQPYIFSNSVKSHPLEIFLLIVVAGLLFGILGMIIAIPAYTVVKVILKEFKGDHRLVKALTRSI